MARDRLRNPVNIVLGEEEAMRWSLAAGSPNLSGGFGA